MIRSSHRKPLVLLDACVLIPSILVDTLLRSAENGFYRVRFSYKILDEFERNFKKRLLKKFGDSGMTPEKAAQLALSKRQAIETAFALDEALIIDFEELEDQMTNDWKDRHVTAAAFKAQIHTIVTANIRHFMPKDLEPFNLEAKHPDQFLSELLQSNTAKMINLLRKQSADYGRKDNARKISLDEMLNYLEVDVPNFVSLVRQLLSANHP